MKSNVEMVYILGSLTRAKVGDRTITLTLIGWINEVVVTKEGWCLASCNLFLASQMVLDMQINQSESIK